MLAAMFAAATPAEAGPAEDVARHEGVDRPFQRP
jgi:hypothetical protein